MIEWCGVYSSQFPSSLDYIVGHFPENPDFKKIKFFFVYSFIQALRKANKPTFQTIDLDDAKRVDNLVSDFKYAGRTYFSQPNQLRIDGRPVVYFWAITSTKGDFKAACGSEPYLLGDELGFGVSPDLIRTPYLDAVMPDMMIKGGTPVRNYKLETTIDDIVGQYRSARLVQFAISRPTRSPSRRPTRPPPISTSSTRSRTSGAPSTACSAPIRRSRSGSPL